MTRVLIVEDEPDLADPLAYLLRREGFEVEIAEDGPAAVEAFAARGADIVLLDLMLPGMPGTEVCRIIRTTSKTPIIMLTAKDSEVDIVVGLELGADDYVTKPYSSRELLARMRAVRRRPTVTALPSEVASATLANRHGVFTMNQHAKIDTAASTKMSPEEWQARVDLAAVYRLCAHYGWDDVIYNHCSMRVPGEPSKFLMKQHELLWIEVTASNLRKVDMNDDLDEKSGVNRPGFTLHGGVLKGRPDVNCAVHVHTETGMALAGLKGGLKMVSQQAMRFYQRIGYHAYEGITEDFGERERILKALGQNRGLILHNHGLLTVGKTAREGFILMKYLMSAATIQLQMQATGGEMIEVPQAICEKVAAQYQTHDSGRGAADWPAYLRILDGIDPGYRN